LLVGFLDAGERHVPAEKFKVFPMGSRLPTLCSAHQIDEIVEALDERRSQFPMEDLVSCRTAGVMISTLSSFLERETEKIHLDLLTPSSILMTNGIRDGFQRDSLRRGLIRVFDILASCALLLWTAPVLLLAAIAIKFEDGIRAKIFYVQNRVGLDGRAFQLPKFRSMREDAESRGSQWAKVEDTRITRVGRWLRRTRIDELPAIFAVLRGDMGFIGPRAELPGFVVQLSEAIPYYGMRHCVKPGITGLAQVRYPYGSSERDALEKLQYDLFSIKYRNPLRDIEILFETVEVILFARGAR